MFISDSNSLKDRRMALNSLKAKLRNSFNVSVCEVDDEGKWRKATLAVVGVSRSPASVNSTLAEVVSFVEGFQRAQLLDYEMEMV